MLLGQLVERWAPELRRTRIRAKSAFLLDCLIRFKLWWDPITEMEPFLHLRRPDAPDGVAVLLISEYRDLVKHYVRHSSLPYDRVLYGSARAQLMIEAVDIPRFCQQAKLPVPSFWSAEPPRFWSAAAPAQASVEPPKPDSVRMTREEAVQHLIDTGKALGVDNYTQEKLVGDVIRLTGVPERTRGYSRNSLRRIYDRLKAAG